MTSPEFLWRDFASTFPIILSIEVGRYVVTAGVASLVVALFWAAWFKARKLQARNVTSADYAREVATSLRTAAIFAITGYGMHLASRGGWLTIYEDLSVRGPVYFVVTLALMILAHDAYFYWTHRMMHHPKLFRFFHRTHHKSRTPTPWTAYAFDVSEAVTMVAFVPLWAVLVTMHEDALFTFVTWQITRNVTGHAGVEIFPVSGRPSKEFGWCNTTMHHDLHHQDARYNFGLYFSWWDRWMGTEHPDYQSCVAEIAARSKRKRTERASSAKIAAGLFAAMFALAVMSDDALADPPPDIHDDWATQGLGAIVRLEPCAANTASPASRNQLGCHPGKSFHGRLPPCR